MKLTKKQQNGLLLVLYVARAGRCKLSEAAKELQLPLPFLEQIANKLRRGGVLESFRGPGGGYQLLGEPTVARVLIVLGYGSENPYSMSKVPEKRALGFLLANLSSALGPILRRKVKSLNLELAANESAAMTGLENTTAN
jgi:Rrf2 family iron-sulfur cluster assembly transcriptional regulator